MTARDLTYASVGVDRGSREKMRRRIAERLEQSSRGYDTANPVKLPFGSVFFSSKSELFLDFQIEGVGTKTMLAEVDPRVYRTIGIDAVAMAANDVIRSGAKPAFVTDAIHIAKSEPRIIQDLVAGVIKGAEECGAILTSGETGDVPEILHEKISSKGGVPFDLFSSCLGFGRRSDLIMGGINEGDAVIGIESSGIHSNGLTLARRVLLKKWGGRYRLNDRAPGFSHSIIEELSTPTRIYTKAIGELSASVRLKAAIHITGDGLAKFQRLADFNADIPNSPSGKQRFGFEFDEQGEIRPIFRLIYETAKSIRRPISPLEMFRTFNMGYGFAVVVDPGDVEQSLGLLNKYYPSRQIGRVSGSGRIKIKNLHYFKESTLLL